MESKLSKFKDVFEILGTGFGLQHLLCPDVLEPKWLRTLEAKVVLGGSQPRPNFEKSILFLWNMLHAQQASTWNLCLSVTATEKCKYTLGPKPGGNSHRKHEPYPNQLSKTCALSQPTFAKTECGPYGNQWEWPDKKIKTYKIIEIIIDFV